MCAIDTNVMIDRPLLSKRLQAALQYLRSKGVVHTVTELANSIGKSQGDVSNALACRGRVMTLGLLERVADAFPDILNRDYLLTGEGEVGLPDKTLKPHFPATVKAGLLSGDLTQVMDYDITMEPPIRRFGQYDYLIDVDGDSMEPTYYSGDTVACRRLEDKSELISGKSYVFVTRDGAVLKRYVSSTLSSVRVSSDNPDYKPYGIDQDNILCVAEVVGLLRNSKNRYYDESWEDSLLKLLDKILVTRGTVGLSEEEKQNLVNQIRGRNQ